MTDDLAARGAARIAWIRSRMPLLARVRVDFAASRPFAGRRIGMSLHLEPKTAVLLETLAAGGAELVVTGNHGSTQDDVVAYLESLGITVHGRRDDTVEQHERNIAAVLDAEPDILLDNGGDLVAGIASRRANGDRAAAGVIGGTEETTSGGLRLRRELDGEVPFPVIVINDSLLKAIGENEHAVGQSVVESIQRITNLRLPGRRALVVGYGWCGRGVARYLRAMGARVVVAEVDELKAFEAAMDGYRVTTPAEVGDWPELVITATGAPGVLGADFFERMGDDVVLANCGHVPWEIDVAALRAMATDTDRVDEAIERLTLAGGRTVVLLADGRMVNLAGREPKGNSLESMDLGFLLQTLSLERVTTRTAELPSGPQPVPDDLDREIARRVLAAMGADR